MSQKTFFGRARRAMRHILICGLLFLLVLSAQAELRFNVSVGYDGVARESTWLPITCELQNDGPPLAGFIEVTSGAYGKGQAQRVPIELPTGTLKRVIIPVFSAGRYQSGWDVRLVDSRGRLIEESLTSRPRQSIGWETKLIGSLSRTAAGTVALRSIKRNQPDVQPMAVRFQPTTFPDNPLVLEGLDAIYLNSEVATSLRTDQVNALVAWMRAGGHLIVAIEQVTDVTGLAWMREILPCEPKEIVGVALHPELQEWIEHGTTVTNFVGSPRGQKKNTSVPTEVSTATAFEDLRTDTVFEAAEIRVAKGNLRDGRVVIASGELPLMVTANRGFGRVTALMFSPEREPFKSWKNLATFWTRLAEVPLELYVSSDYTQNYGYGLGVDGLFGALIDSRQVHKLPVGWLLLLLLVYLAVIGPVDRIWLKKINRPMLTWITFPCYVVLFSGLIYLIGYRLRAGESEYNELHVVDVLARGNRAELRGRTYASIYSPANARYPMQSELPFATLRGEYLTARGGETSEKGSLLHTGDNFRAEVFVPVWTSQLYLSDWWSAADTPLAGSLTSSNGQWHLTVKNFTGKTIPEARLAFGKKIFTLGLIPANEPKSFVVGSAEWGEELPDFVRNAAQEYRSAVQQRQYAFGHRDSGIIDDSAKATVVASLLGEVGRTRNDAQFVSSPGLDVSAAVRQGEAVLFAWATNSAPVPALTTLKTKRTAVSTLWRVPIIPQTQN